MKLRKGFVSNSSSSSFTCLVCGGEFVGWDGMYESGVEERECMNGHTLCRSHKIKVELTEEEEGSCWDGVLHSKECPICAMQIILPGELAMFLLREYQLDRKTILEKIRSTFSDYTEFQRYITGAAE